VVTHPEEIMATARRNGARPGPSAATPTAGALSHEKIAARAYEIWQVTGRSHGHDQEDWFQAERELSISPLASRTPPR
jgi:hypothetical protein